MKIRIGARFVPLLLILVMTGCGGATVDDLTVEDAWARTTPPSATEGVVYLTITSPVDDALVGVEVPAEVAASATLHETMTDGGSSMADMPGMDHGDDGMSSMTSLERVELAAGEPVELAPGARHIMLSDLAAPLESGASFEATLQFATQPDLRMTVRVLDNAP